MDRSTFDLLIAQRDLLAAGLMGMGVLIGGFTYAQPKKYRAIYLGALALATLGIAWDVAARLAAL